MHFQRDDVIGVVEMVWETALGLPAALDHAQTSAEPRVVGSVAIAGACEGEVTVCCGHRLARRAAASLFARPEVDVTREDINDAVGELANMTGGNLKALLPEGCTLSLPAISESDSYTTGDGETISFVSCGLPFTVTFAVRQGVPGSTETTGALA